MRLPGVRTAIRTAGWMRSRVIGGALILGYHRVDDLEPDPYSLRVRVAHFAEQLTVLRRECSPMRLHQLLEGLDHGRLPPNPVVLTFDDGYSSLLHAVKPLLER